jgi:CheY-like chemotaxis protein
VRANRKFPERSGFAVGNSRVSLRLLRREAGRQLAMKLLYPDPTLSPFVIVDDFEDDIFLLRHRLREGGITNPIRAFTSPAEAMRFIREARAPNELPAIVFTDIRMPVDGGLAFIAAIRENRDWDNVRIVVVTASNERADLERALEHGANGYLLKFPTADILAEFVRYGPWFATPKPDIVAATKVLAK